MCDFNASTLYRICREIADLDNELETMINSVFKLQQPRVLEEAIALIDHREDRRAKEVLETMIESVKLRRRSNIQRCLEECVS